MKTILITGHEGLLGSACVELFEKKGWEVVGVDNHLREKFFDLEKTKPHLLPDRYFVDIRDSVAIERIFKKHKFDAIIHTAAQPSHDYATDHVMEDFTINALGTISLLEAARKSCPDAVFVYVSTDKVYGENMTGFLTEFSTRYSPSLPIVTEGFKETIPLDLAGIRSFFGCSKLAADMYAQEYAARFGMKVGIFRPGCITGKNHKGAEMHGMLSYLAKCIKEGKTYTIHGNGKQVRDQIHADDVATAFLHFVSNPITGGVFNLGGGPTRSVSVLEAGALLSKEIGKPFLHAFGPPHRTGDRLWDVHDVSKFRKAYPEWDYAYSLRDIIRDLV